MKRVRADAESPSINSITQLVNLVRPFMRNSLTDTDAVCDFICLATSAISWVAMVLTSWVTPGSVSFTIDSSSVKLCSLSDDLHWKLSLHCSTLALVLLKCVINLVSSGSLVSSTGPMNSSTLLFGSLSLGPSASYAPLMSVFREANRFLACKPLGILWPLLVWVLVLDGVLVNRRVLVLTGGLPGRPVS